MAWKIINTLYAMTDCSSMDPISNKQFLKLLSIYMPVFFHIKIKIFFEI